MYRICPFCGAHLDPSEVCDCRKSKKEDAPDAAEAPSKEPNLSADSVSDSPRNVNRCFRLRDIRLETGAMAKDVALVVREKFPKFNRQLLAQCEAWDKYGVIIHPDGLRAICDTYGVNAGSADPPVSPIVTGSSELMNGVSDEASGLTQCERILRHFRDYGSITSLEAMKEYGIMRLASRISDLKRQGYNISVTTESGKNRYGETTSYARYSLQEVPHGSAS